MRKDPRGAAIVTGSWAFWCLVAGLTVPACAGRAGAPSSPDGSDAKDAKDAKDAPVVTDGGPGTVDAGIAERGTGPDSRSPQPSPPIEIGLAPSPDPLRPFQHAAEVSVAAHDGHVVIAAINIHTDGPDTLAASALLRGVTVADSHDWGASFTNPRNPGFDADETSDPVTRVTTDGTFWVSAIWTKNTDAGLSGGGTLLRSRTDGRSFTVAHNDLSAYDKEWLAPTADGGLVMGANGGFWRFLADGTVADSWLGGPDWAVFGAFADAQDAHFVLEGAIVRWTGGATYMWEGSAGVEGTTSDVGWSVPIGLIAGGGIWAVYGRSGDLTVDMSQLSGRNVRMKLFAPGVTAGQELPISAEDATAFMPAAAMDGDGRLHVIFYDSTGTTGVLKYTRSVSADLREGFESERIVDPGACPGGGWYPDFGQSARDRRLREYIDLAIDGHRVHMAWTHAPTLPSRIWTSHLDF